MSPAKRRAWLLVPLAAFLFSRLPFGSASDRYVIESGESRLSVVVDGTPRGLSPRELRDWIETSAGGLAAYLGRFPVKEARVAVRVGEGRGVSQGRTSPGTPPVVRIALGAEATRRSLDADWILVHEMIHLAFPSVEGPHDWMSEGLATYAEPIARVRNGTLSEERFWSDMIRDLPQGIPEPADRGFNNSPSWASTYWGGALFWFLVDVEMRQATSGTAGLEDGLRALNEKGGDFTTVWNARDVLNVIDGAAGAPVAARLYESWALSRGEVDLDRLWTRLGVVSLSSRRGGVGFDDNAPLAGVRRAILRGSKR